jgi:hypothetical protein
MRSPLTRHDLVHKRSEKSDSETRQPGRTIGNITGNPDGSVDTSRIVGVDTDLRVGRSAEAHSIREFVVRIAQGDGLGFDGSRSVDSQRRGPGSHAVGHGA